MDPSSHSATSRRTFIRAVSAGLVATAVAPTAFAAAGNPQLPVIGFVKPFQKLPFDQIADTAREAGWDGIECPVRKNGTIEPQAAQDLLPKLVETFRTRNLPVSVLATDVEDATDPLAQTVLRTASKLGIKRYRLKHYYYDLAKPIAPQLKEFAAKLRDLAQLNAELGITGSMQNHSGKTYVGAPVWDLWEMMRTLDPKAMGVFFDIGHATVEGGYAWPIHAKLIEPHLSVVSVKDFSWAKDGKGTWRAEWCPLGEGMVRPEFFKSLRASRFNGPVSLHFEYKLGNPAQTTAAMKKDTAILRQWLG